MKKTTFTLALLCATLLSLGACSNTFQGAGQDIEKAGKWIQGDR